MALPLDLSSIEQRVFYLAGGYKYAMAGEGCCFVHCPPGYAERPVDTGWYGVFGLLEDEQSNQERVPYATDGMRLMGSTFDPTGVYRLSAALGRWQELGVDARAIHRHVEALQAELLARVEDGRAGPLALDQLRPPVDFAERGHFLTFERPDATTLHEDLLALDVVTDVRGRRIRFGFGAYHDMGDVDELCLRLARLAGDARNP